MVIVDSSTLIHLSAIGRFALLKDLYGKLTVTPAVWREVVVRGRTGPASRETGAIGVLRFDALTARQWLADATRSDKMWSKVPAPLASTQGQDRPSATRQGRTRLERSGYS